MEVMEMPIQKYSRAKPGEIIIKQYAGKTVISKYPDMTNVVPSGSQLEKRSRFAEAVAYARTINNSPILKADFLKRSGPVRSVYQAALKEFLRREVIS